MKKKNQVKINSGLRWLFYSVITYVLLIPLQIWVASIGISLVVGLLFWFLNEIMTFRRIQLGQRFPGYPPYDKEDKPDELIKS